MRKRGGHHSGGLPVGKQKSVTNANGAPVSQVARIRSIESQMYELLNSVSSDVSEGTVRRMGKSSGGIDDRMVNIGKMTEELTAVIAELFNKKNELETQKQLPTSENIPIIDNAVATESDELKKKRNKKRKFVPLNMENYTEGRKYSRYFLVKFTEQSKRSVNPYSLIEKIESITGSKPKNVTGSNRSSFTVEVQSAEQSEKILSLKEVEGIPCETILHPKFNFCEGLIYVHAFDVEDLEEFKSGLQENYNVDDVIPAKFIKPKNPETKAFLVTFKQETLPYSLYIPGEPRDTLVNKFHNKPFMCKKCQQYGHSKKWCKNKKSVCKRCSTTEHETVDCTALVPLCLHCAVNPEQPNDQRSPQSEHAIGSMECPRHKKEIELLDIQDKEKVNIMRARQIRDNNNEHVIRTKKNNKYATHFDCILSEDDKRKFTPWLLEKCLALQLGSKPRSIRSTNTNSFTVEINTEKESQIMSELKNINNIPIEIQVNNSISIIQGLVYVYNYNMADFDKFKEGLKKQYGLQEAIEPHWIKAREKVQAKPLLLNFREELPAFIDIPGEMMRTRVYEYKKRPLMCATCQEYGHTKNHCNNDVRCGKCSEEGHQESECESNDKLCFHCKGKHNTRDRTCRIFKYEEEITAIQAKQHVPRSQAKIMFDRINPNFTKMNYRDILMRNEDDNPRASEGETSTKEVSTGNKRKLNESNSPDILEKETPMEEVSTRPKRKLDENNGKEEERPPKKKETEIVCMSPVSGTLFTTTVELPVGLGMESNSEDVNDSETLAEVREIFDQFTDANSEQQNDREQYEMELQKATTTQGNNTKRKKKKPKKDRSKSPHQAHNKLSADHFKK